VSTLEQDETLKPHALTAAGCQRIFVDKVSGKLEHRPPFDAMLEQLCPPDNVAVWRLERLGRSLRLAFFCASSTSRVSFVRVESGVDPVALRDARLRMGLTQHELARLIEVAGGERISRWELGTSVPRPEILHRLAQALNVGAADLFQAGAPADLRRLRTAAGLSASSLAAQAHMSVPTYVRWESGRIKRLPVKQALKPLAKALNVTVEDVESAIVTARANAGQAD
jgi:transcriptional regulator with XRE-family HTH domain